MPFRHLRQLLVATVSVALAAGLLPLLGASSAEAATKPRRFVSGWAPYWGMSEALQTIDANDSLFASVDGFWHSAKASTTIDHSLSNAARADAVAQLHAQHIAVYGTVTDRSGTGHMAAVLRSPSKRLAHVRTLVNLAVANHYDGIDLDYEGFAFHDGRASWAKTRPAWVTFIRQLSSSLHAHGKKLAVSTPAIYDATAVTAAAIGSTTGTASLRTSTRSGSWPTTSPSHTSARSPRSRGSTPSSGSP